MSAALVQKADGVPLQVYAGFIDLTGVLTGTDAIHFPGDTTAGSLLVCVITATDTNAAGASVSIQTPVTSGLDWVLADSTTCDEMEWHTDRFQSATAIYYVANAPSIASSVYTSVTVNIGYAGLDDGAAFQIYEFSGISGASPLALTAIGRGAEGIPSAGDIAVPVTGLIIVSQSNADIVPGPGWSLLDDPGWFPNSEAMFNAPAGTYTAKFSALSYGWSVVVAAFISAPSGPAITLTFENATDTGDYYVN